MPIDVKLDQELDNTVYVKFIGNWSWDDYHTALDKAYELVKDIDDRIDQILDFTDTYHIPNGSSSPHLERGRKHNIQEKLTVVIGKVSFLRMLYRAMSINFNPKSPNIVQNLEQARDLVRQDRTTTNPPSSTP